MIAPLAYARPSGGSTSYGVGDIELGAKLRFIDEGQWRPMVGTFPMFELQTGEAARRLGTGHLHVLIPLWLQRSFGAWTSYGGGGLWVNPGRGNRNYGYFGWQLQRRLSRLATIGTEVFYTTPDQVGGRCQPAFQPRACPRSRRASPSAILGRPRDCWRHYLPGLPGLSSDDLGRDRLSLGTRTSHPHLIASRRNLPCVQPSSPKSTSPGN